MLHSEARNPRFINFLAYLLWSFPLTYIMMLGAFYNLSLTKMASIVFSFYYIAHSVLAVFTGLALYRMRPFAWHFFVFHSFAMSVAQFVVAYRYGENHVVEIPLAFVNLVILGLLLFLKR